MSLYPCTDLISWQLSLAKAAETWAWPLFYSSSRLSEECALKHASCGSQEEPVNGTGRERSGRSRS